MNPVCSRKLTRGFGPVRVAGLSFVAAWTLAFRPPARRAGGAAGFLAWSIRLPAGSPLVRRLQDQSDPVSLQLGNAQPVPGVFLVGALDDGEGAVSLRYELRQGIA